MFFQALEIILLHFLDIFNVKKRLLKINMNLKCLRIKLFYNARNSILLALEDEYTHTDIARYLKISSSMVSNILEGFRWWAVIYNINMLSYII